MAERYRVTVSCQGISSHEASGGISAILEEFYERPWHTEVACRWDGEKILLTAENDYDSNGSAVLDEFCDAVHACISWSAEEIAFAVESVIEVKPGQ